MWAVRGTSIDAVRRFNIGCDRGRLRAVARRPVRNGPPLRLDGTTINPRNVRINLWRPRAIHSGAARAAARQLTQRAGAARRRAASARRLASTPRSHRRPLPASTSDTASCCSATASPAVATHRLAGCKGDARTYHHSVAAPTAPSHSTCRSRWSFREGSRGGRRGHFAPANPAGCQLASSSSRVAASSTLTCGC